MAGPLRLSKLHVNVWIVDHSKHLSGYIHRVLYIHYSWEISSWFTLKKDLAVPMITKIINVQCVCYLCGFDHTWWEQSMGGRLIWSLSFKRSNILCWGMHDRMGALIRVDQKGDGGVQEEAMARYCPQTPTDINLLLQSRPHLLPATTS